jgi:AcrR family transcriptional regulator
MPTLQSSTANRAPKVCRGSKVHREPTPDEVVVLRLLAEQVAIPLDQLSRFLQVDTRQTEAVATAISEAGCIGMDSLLSGEQRWIWLSSRGAKRSGTDFRALKPNLITLGHRRAVNEVRLYLAERAPEGRWVCERTIVRQREPGERLPDAIFEIDGERHAIEVELSNKSKTGLRQVLLAHSKRYDAVVYFCGRRTLRPTQAVQAEGNWPRLLVRPLPSQPRELTHLRRTAGGHLRHLRRYRDPTPEEIAFLALITEQAAVPLDQLARLLRRDLQETVEIVERLWRPGFVRCECSLPGEATWVWPTGRGVRLSGTGLSEPRLRLGALPRMRLVNEVRLHIAARAPEARWISGRRIAHGRNRRGRRLDGVVEIGEERHAIQVRLAASSVSALEDMVEHHSANYDAIVCFCAPPAYRQLKRQACVHHWPKLVLRHLPQPGLTDDSARSVDIAVVPSVTGVKRTPPPPPWADAEDEFWPLKSASALTCGRSRYRGLTRAGMPAAEVAVHQRRRLDRAIVEVVSERGYAQMRVSDVVEHAGVARKTFYKFFSDKGDCFRATFDQIVALAAARVGAEEHCDLRRDQRLRKRLEILADRRHERLLDHFAVLLAAGRDEEPGGDELPALSERFLLAAVASILAEWLGAEGEPGPAGSPRLAAELIGFVLLPYVGPASARVWARLRRAERPRPPADEGIMSLQAVEFTEVLSHLQGVIGSQAQIVIGFPGHFFVIEPR